MSLVDYRSTKRGEIPIAALPGTHVRVQWIHENGAIEYERVYRRPKSQAVNGVDMNGNLFQILIAYERAIQDLQALLVEERREHAELKSRIEQG